MERQRLVLRITWRQVAERADLSIAGLGAIRRGERNPSALARARIEHALEWETGSIESVLAGGEPTPRGAGGTSTAADVHQLRQELHAMERDREALRADELAPGTYKVIARALDQEIDQLRSRLRSLGDGVSDTLREAGS